MSPVRALSCPCPCGARLGERLPRTPGLVTAPTALGPHQLRSSATGLQVVRPGGPPSFGSSRPRTAVRTHPRRSSAVLTCTTRPSGPSATLTTARPSRASNREELSTMPVALPPTYLILRGPGRPGIASGRHQRPAARGRFGSVDRSRCRVCCANHSPNAYPFCDENCRLSARGGSPSCR